VKESTRHLPYPKVANAQNTEKVTANHPLIHLTINLTASLPIQQLDIPLNRNILLLPHPHDLNNSATFSSKVPIIHKVHLSILPMGFLHLNLMSILILVNL
jgi:hypothetical protein